MIKFLIDKYSFLGGILMFLAFVVSSLSLTIDRTQFGYITWMLIWFIFLYYLKIIFKNKFDLLRNKNKFYQSTILLELIILFMLTPSLMYLSKFYDVTSLSKIQLIKNGVTTGISFLFIFLFYNGYTKNSCTTIRKALGLCFVIDVIICIACYCWQYYSMFNFFVTFTLFNGFLYLIAIIGLIKRDYLIKEKVLNNSIYRCKYNNGKITTIYKEFTKGVYITLPKYQNILNPFDSNISNKWNELSVELECIPLVTVSKQFTNNNFYDNPIFRLFWGVKSSSTRVFNFNCKEYLIGYFTFVLCLPTVIGYSNIIISSLIMGIIIYFSVYLVIFYYQKNKLTGKIKYSLLCALVVILDIILLMWVPIDIYSKAIVLAINFIWFWWRYLKYKLALLSIEDETRAFGSV